MAGILAVAPVGISHGDVVSFKDASRIKGWDAWNDHKKGGEPDERPSVTFGKIKALDPGLKEIGRLESRDAKDIKTSKWWSIGCETLDRDYADWNVMKKWLGPLGARHGRLISGWAKTEQSKGEYDFTWLDPQVREMAAIGVKPWICLAYGNPVWGSDFRLGMRVRQITGSPEAFDAWLAYCSACVERYKDVVDEWEVWNEPFEQGPDYAELFYRTAKAIRSVQPAAKIFCAACRTADYKCVLEKLKAENTLDLGSYFIYHPYDPNPDISYAKRMEPLRAQIKEYSDSFDVMQGECGCPSQLEFAHAMKNVEWSEYKQAKWLLRRTVGDAVRGIPSSVFTLIDLQYTFMLQSFGLIRSNTLKEFVYRRPSFYAMQNVFGFFDDDVQPSSVCTNADFSVLSRFDPRDGGRALTVASFLRLGRPAHLLWYSDRQPTDQLGFDRVSLRLPGSIEHPVLVEMITGRIFEIPSDCVAHDGGGMTLTNIPLWDSPLMVAGRDTVAFAPEGGLASTGPKAWAAVSRRVAAEGTVLLKNENGTLPLAAGSRVEVLGSKRYIKCGGGSAKVDSPYQIDVPQGLAAAGMRVLGDDPNADDSPDAAVVLVPRWTSEGGDPDDSAFELSEEELKTVEAAAGMCSKVVVVLNAGHPVNLKPLKDNPRVGAILFAWYPGMEGGAAIADIIAGKVNPSGRLADTFAEKISDYPSNKYFRADPLNLDYGEGADVGYRYFNAKAKDRIVYPFGFGLSYTTFSESEPVDGGDGTISVDVRNTGAVPGRHSALHYEGGELSAYAKTRLLAPGESETLRLRPYRPLPRMEPSPADAEADALLARLSPAQKVNLCSAQPPAMPRGTAGIGNLPQFGIPNAQTADGPNGVRCSVPSTCHPASALLAQTFDDELAYEMGRALGEEAALRNVDILLGPGLNIHRHPLCGRNFEYFSEDPLLSGKMAAAYVRGVQSTGTAATIKHFCCNNREWNRKDYSANVDGKTLRDIYLKGFEIAVKEGRPRCVMTSYNKVNGTFSGECGWLVNGILRGEWGFDGLVMTDWRTHSEMWRQIAAGTDVNMPFGYQEKVDLALGKLESGELDAGAVDASARRVLREVKQSRRFRNGDFGPVTKVSAAGGTAVPAKTASCVSSTWSEGFDDPAEGWCHSALGQDPRGLDTFVAFELDVERAGAYDASIRAYSENATSRLSFECGGAETEPLSCAKTGEWMTLGPVRVELPSGRTTLKVWVRGGAKFSYKTVPGVRFSRLLLSPAAGKGA